MKHYNFQIFFYFKQFGKFYMNLQNASQSKSAWVFFVFFNEEKALDENFHQALLPIH